MSRSRKSSAPRSASALPASAGSCSAFWDEIECEIEALDVRDFEEFLEADALPIDPDPAFRKRLSGHLKQLVRSRFAH